MGSSRIRGWNFTRQELYAKCPRAYFYEYYPWGESNPHEDILWFLKRATTVPMLVGTVVHDAVALALRGFRESKYVYKDLAPLATRWYDEHLAESQRIAAIVRSGKRPPDEGTVIASHLIGGQSELVEQSGRAAVADHLKAFSNSATWEFLRSTDPKGWYPISDRPRYFKASAALGFSKARGIRLYTVFDLAFRQNNDCVIIDWKTGQKKADAILRARRQLAGYALWAISKGRTLDKIKTQVVFLTDGETWRPESVTQDEVDQVRDGIEQHIASENQFVRRTTSPDGDVKWVARVEDFPARPRAAICTGCKFRTVCKAGQASELTSAQAA